MTYLFKPDACWFGAGVPEPGQMGGSRTMLACLSLRLATRATLKIRMCAGTVFVKGIDAISGWIRSIKLRVGTKIWRRFI